MVKINENKKAYALILLGSLFMAIGIYRGELLTVLTKASSICLECIGIG